MPNVYSSVTGSNKITQKALNDNWYKHTHFVKNNQWINFYGGEAGNSVELAEKYYK